MKCLRCKRALKDPKSVERQYGPVCWGKVQAEKERDAYAQDGDTLTPRWHEPVILDDLPEESGKEYVFNGNGPDCQVTVRLGEREYPLPHIVYHSPAGFAWGYGGSGPADLARSILWDLCGQKVADTYYQSFKRSWIAYIRETTEHIVVSADAVLYWLRKKVGTEIREWSN